MLRQGSQGEPSAFAPQWMKEKIPVSGDKPSQSPQPQRRPDEKPWVADRWGSVDKEAGDPKWGGGTAGSAGEASFAESRLSRWATEDERQRVQPPRGPQTARWGKSSFENSAWGSDPPPRAGEQL